MPVYFLKTFKSWTKIRNAGDSEELCQIQTARLLIRISPAVIVRCAFEVLAVTGLPRHLDFISQTRQYAKQFQQFLIDTDRADPESPHAVGTPEGTSQKPVNGENLVRNGKLNSHGPLWLLT